MPVKINLGCGRNIRKGWINVDWAALEGVDVIADLDQCRSVPLPFDSDSVDEILISHVIEHLNDPLSLMQEAYRIAKPGSYCVVRVPYGASDEAWEDQTHKRAYFLGSFGYFSQPYYWKADYGYRGDWQPEVIRLTVGREHTGANGKEFLKRINSERNLVREMVAVLRAVKPIREPKAELQTAPEIRIETP